VRWVVTERGSEKAAELLDRPIAWIAPRLMLTEVASALRRKVAGGELEAEIAVHALGVIVDAIADGVIRLADDEQLIGQALLLALMLRHRVPDCLYLALAEREGAGLATADERLGGLARDRGLPTHLVPSE